MRLRPATTEDAQAILDIYNHQVLTSTATFDLVPRTIEEQRAWLTERSGAHVVLVAEADDAGVAGFGALSPYRERAGYATTVEDSVYVSEARQGEGIGGLILEALVERARSHGFHALMAKIVGSHEVSIGLHRRHGFDVVGRELQVGRKFGRWLDVVLMERLL